VSLNSTSQEVSGLDARSESRKPKEMKGMKRIKELLLVALVLGFFAIQ
jgi:hypothetical protein